MFTHRMKESLGLAEKTTSNEQVRDLAKKLDTIAEHLKMIMKGVQKTTAGLRGAFFNGISDWPVLLFLVRVF